MRELRPSLVRYRQGSTDNGTDQKRELENQTEVWPLSDEHMNRPTSHLTRLAKRSRINGNVGAMNERDRVMRKLAACSVLVLSAAIVLGDPTSSATRINQPNTNAFVAKINSVTVLEFNTDRPVTGARVSVDGKVAGSTGGNAAGKGLKIAIVPASTNVTIHLQAGPSIGWFLTAEYPQPVRDDLRERETFGSGKDLVVGEWQEVYSITHTLQGKVTYRLLVEIK